MAMTDYFRLLSNIPRGKFYHTTVVPFKTDTYPVRIDTLNPLAEYDIELDGTLYKHRTDISGLLRLQLHLSRGLNKLSWRKVGSEVWVWREIETSNLATLISGVATGMKQTRIDVERIRRNASILTAESLFPWKQLYGVGDLMLTIEQLEEIVQAFWNFSEKEKSVRQISGVVQNVPVTVERIGSFTLGTNWLHNGKYNADLDGYQIMNTHEHSILTNQVDFGSFLSVLGDTTVEIYPFVNKGKEGESGQWIFKVWNKWGGMGSGQIQVGISMDGVTWIWSTPAFPSSFWQEFSIHSPTKPVRVGVRYVNTSLNFKMHFGWMFLVNEDVNLTTPQITGAQIGRKPMALWRWI